MPSHLCRESSMPRVQLLRFAPQRERGNREARERRGGVGVTSKGLAPLERREAASLTRERREAEACRLEREEKLRLAASLLSPFSLSSLSSLSLVCVTYALGASLSEVLAGNHIHLIQHLRLLARQPAQTYTHMTRRDAAPRWPLPS